MRLSTRIRRTLSDPVSRHQIRGMRKLEQALARQEDVVHATADSPRRFEIMAEGLALHDDHPPVPGFPRSVPFIMSSMRNIKRSIRTLSRNPARPKRRVSEEFLAELTEFAHSVGVDALGYTALPPDRVFANKAVLHDKAIVLVMEMSQSRMAHAPSRDTAVMVHETYDKLGQASNAIAGFLRERGYSAHAGHPLMGLALYPPLAQAAGLGWRGMSGLLITPQFGPRVRLAAVFTDIENLPLTDGDTTHQWIERYCDICRLCAKDCPPKAIYDTPVPYGKGLVHTVDSAKCFPYFANNHGCSICIKVCPFNHVPYEKLREHIDYREQRGHRASDGTAGQHATPVGSGAPERPQA